MSSTTLYTILLSILASFIYDLIFSHKIDAIRGYFKNRASGVVRRIYINAFVSAVRGKDKVTDTSILAYLMLFICVLPLLHIYQQANDVVRSYKQTVAEVKRIQERVPPPNLEEVSSDIKDLEDDISQTNTISKALFWVSFGVVLWGLLFWRPYILIRKKFSHEIDLYLRRIQGLASKQELSKLALLESRVKNEVSLKEFIFLTKEIAARHEAVELVSNFELWN